MKTISLEIAVSTRSSQQAPSPGQSAVAHPRTGGQTANLPALAGLKLAFRATEDLVLVMLGLIAWATVGVCLFWGW